MKPIINFITKFIIVVIMIKSSDSIAQNWVNATVPNITYSGSPSAYGALYASNSINRTVFTVGGVQYADVLSATAWDGVNGAYIGWAYDDGHGHLFDGVITIPGHVSSAHTLHPDVVVIRRANGIFYIVVASYNSGGNGGVNADWFALTVTSNLPSGPTLSWASPAYTVLSSANLPSSPTVNLDVSQGDKLVAVWTESVSGTLQVKAKTAKFVSNVLTWSSNTFMFPSFTYSGNTYTAPFRDADVAVLQKSNGDNVATFCMIKAEANYYDKLIISEDIAFSDLEAGTTFTSLAASVELDYASTTIAQPRIDRQRQIDPYDQTGWTVVFVKYASSVADICGIISFYDLSTFTIHDPINYTNGTEAEYWNVSNHYLPDINNENSFYPVVTYDKRSGDVDPNDATVFVIAFNHYDGSNIVPLCFYAQYESGLPFKASGAQEKFYSIPYNASGDETYIAVSGSESKFFMYSWVHQNSPYAIEYKHVDTKDPLRIGNIEGENNNAIIFNHSYAVPFSMPAEFKQLQLYSTTGNLIAMENGNTNYSDAFNKLNNGLYIAKFIMNDDNSVSRKIIISK